LKLIKPAANDQTELTSAAKIKLLPARIAFVTVVKVSGDSGIGGFTESPGEGTNFTVERKPMPLDLFITLLTFAIIFFQMVFLFIPLGSDKISRGKVPQVTITIASLNTLIFIFSCVLKSEEEVSYFYNLFSLAPFGKWQLHQPLSYAFMHGSTLHLVGNMIFFIALSVALEELIGSNLFLAFYLLACVFSCTPFLLFPEQAPLVGASGAISAIMGAFLVMFFRSKIKIGWLSIPLYPFLLLFRKKGHGTIFIPAAIVLPYFFITDVLMWHFFKMQEIVSGVAHSVHIAGFIFGAGMAFWLKNTSLLKPKLNEEAAFYHSYYKSVEVRRALEILERGDIQLAGRKLLAILERNPGDIEALEAITKLYIRICDYQQVKQCFIRLIQYHLSQGDKHGALQGFRNLLTLFPDDDEKPILPVYEWMQLCDYSRQCGLLPLALAEYERLAIAYPNTPNAVKAFVQGGEAALAAEDVHRAYRLFTSSLMMCPGEAFELRALRGIEKCSLVMGVDVTAPALVLQAPAAFESNRLLEIVSDRT
jgi:membrane associated rhomboid family serine protease